MDKERLNIFIFYGMKFRFESKSIQHHSIKDIILYTIDSKIVRALEIIRVRKFISNAVL